MLGPPCCTGFCLVVESRGSSLVAVHGLPVALASLVEHVFQGTQGSVVVALGLSSCVRLLGSRVQAQLLRAHGVSCSVAPWDLPRAGIKLVSPCIGRRLLYH